MSARFTATLCSVALGSLACGFEASGSEETDGGSSGSSTTTSSSSSGSDTTSSETGTTSTKDPSTSSEGTSTTVAATDDGGSSTGSPLDECDDPALFTATLTVTDSMLAGGMMQANDPMFGDYAYSEADDLGLVTFDFSVPCSDTYHLWALVWDEERAPFIDGGNPDTFAVTIDLGSEFVWPYGCQTLFQVEPWSYERVQVADPMNCEGETEQVFALAAGIHEVSLRNVEGGSFDDNNAPGDVAAVARVFVTNDPSYIPDPDVD